MWKWLLPISLLSLLGLASGIGMSSGGSGMSSSGFGTSSSGTGLTSAVGPSTETGNTPSQQSTIEGLRIVFHLGQMYTSAQQGYNISGYNAEVDKYNAWVQKNFGNDQNLMMPKMPVQGSEIQRQQVTRNPFNASGDLSKFGKQQVFGEGLTRGDVKNMEAISADQALRDFLYRD
jgi:hypothetical protein